jgi:DNA-binding transcriptional regulator YiaG
MQADELLARARSASRLPAAIRDSAGVTQRELAAVLGVSVMTLNRWERGLVKPRGVNAARYAELLEQLDSAAA